MSTIDLRVGSYGTASIRSAHSSRIATDVRAVQPRLRLTRRGRAVFTTLASIPLVIAAFAFALSGGGATASLDGSSVPFEYVTVEAGQSLWAIAESIAPEADPRDVIAAIMSLNQLDSADVVAGEQLAIPAIYAD